MKRTVLLLTATFGLAACATPETRLRTGLMDAGLSPSMSACMADRMVNELSIIQLRKLQSLKGLKKRDARDLSVNEFVHRVRALRDPEILGETTRAAGACALGL